METTEATTEEKIVNSELVTLGDIIKIKVPLYNHCERFIDKIGIVTAVQGSNITVEIPEPVSSRYPTNIVIVVSGVKINPEDLLETVSALQFLKLIRQYRQLSIDADKAVSVISDRLITESEDRDWCDEFDTIIDEVNEELPTQFQLRTRERNYNVTWTETYTVTVQRHANLNAANTDAAIDMATELEGEADYHELNEAVRNNNFEFNDSDDYDVELN